MGIAHKSDPPLTAPQAPESCHLLYAEAAAVEGKSRWYLVTIFFGTGKILMKILTSLAISLTLVACASGTEPKKIDVFTDIAREWQGA